jgi:hypothetical protein
MRATSIKDVIAKNPAKTLRAIGLSLLGFSAAIVIAILIFH